MKEDIRNLTNSYKSLYEQRFPARCQSTCAQCDNIIIKLKVWSIENMEEMKDLRSVLESLIQKNVDEMKEEIRNMTNSYLIQLKGWSIEDMEHMKGLRSKLESLIRSLQRDVYRVKLAQNPDAKIWPPNGGRIFKITDVIPACV